jgi:hypothetical protein
MLDRPAGIDYSRQRLGRRVRVPLASLSSHS